jgi:hypothetical protein
MTFQWLVTYAIKDQHPTVRLISADMQRDNPFDVINEVKKDIINPEQLTSFKIEWVQTRDIE